MLQVDFETWKKEYAPILQVDNIECDEHADNCECEFFYPFEKWEIIEDEDNNLAIHENRVWTWRPDGAIVSGFEDGAEYYLITEQPYNQKTLVK